MLMGLQPRSLKTGHTLLGLGVPDPVIVERFLNRCVRPKLYAGAKLSTELDQYLLLFLRELLTHLLCFINVNPNALPSHLYQQRNEVALQLKYLSQPFFLNLRVEYFPEL